MPCITLGWTKASEHDVGSLWAHQGWILGWILLTWTSSLVHHHTSQNGQHILRRALPYPSDAHNTPSTTATASC